MNYEIVNLEEKRVVGLAARTNNQSPEMGAVIGGLWEKVLWGRCLCANREQDQ